MRQRSLLLIIFILCIKSVIAQECECKEANSEVQQFDKLLKQSKADSAAIIVDKVGALNSIPCKVMFHLLSAKLNFSLKELEKTQHFLTQGKKLLRDSKCKDLQIIGFNYVQAQVYFQSDQLDSAAVYLLRVVESSERNKDKEYHAKAYSFLAGVFGKMKQYEKAIDYVKRSIRLNEADNNQSALATNYSVLSTAYSYIFNRTDTFKAYFDSSSYAAHRAVFFAKQSNNKEVLKGGYNKIAGQNIFLKKYDIAEKYLDSSLSLSLNQPNDANFVSVYYRKADLYRRTGKFPNAISCIDTTLKYSFRTRAVGSVADCYQLLCTIYKETGDYKNALAATERMRQYSDSVNSNEKSKTINELEQKYQKAENEKKISELNKENEIASLNVKILAVGILAAVLVTIVIIFFYRQSVLKNKFKALETEQRLNRARMDPHFFFNALTSIQTLSLDEENTKKVPSLIAKFSKIMRQSLESTYDELITIEEEVIFLTNYLDLQKLRYNNKFDYGITVDDSLEQDEIKVPGMLLQPFIENSIEHGFKNIEYKGLLSINFIKEANNLKVELKDNGVGFNTDSKHKEYPSRATQIINDRLALLNKKQNSTAGYKLSKNPEGKGILVEVNLPVIT